MTGDELMEILTTHTTFDKCVFQLDNNFLFNHINE